MRYGQQRETLRTKRRIMDSIALRCARTGKERRPPPLARINKMPGASSTQVQTHLHAARGIQMADQHTHLASPPSTGSCAASPSALSSTACMRQATSVALVAWVVSNICKATRASDSGAHRCGSYYQPPALKQKDEKHHPGQKQACLPSRHANAHAECQRTRFTQQKCNKCSVSQIKASRPALAIPARWARLPQAAQCTKPAVK